MRTPRVRAIVCAAAMMLASAVQAGAGTITTPASSGTATLEVFNGWSNAQMKWISGNTTASQDVPFQLPKFDSSLGSLTKVEVLFDVTSAHDYYYDFLHDAVINSFDTDAHAWFSFYNRAVQFLHPTWPITHAVNYTTPYIISSHGYPQHDTYGAVLTNSGYDYDYLGFFKGSPGDTFTLTGSFAHTVTHFDWHWADPTLNDSRYELDSKMLFTYTASAIYTFDPAAAAPLPEPSSLLLLGTGLAGAVGRRWRKRRS